MRLSQQSNTCIHRTHIIKNPASTWPSSPGVSRSVRALDRYTEDHSDTVIINDDDDVFIATLIISLFMFVCFFREINGLVGDYLSLSQVANKDPNCSFSLAGPNFFNFGLGLALPKASPWISDVNQAVLKHQENGTIQTIEKRWFNKNSCDSKPFTALGIINFSGLFMTVVVVLGFCVFAVLAEFFIVIMLIRLGTRLGAFGKFIKRFAFNVKEGEEDELNMKYSFLLRRQRKASWNVTPSAETTDMFQELGFHNDASFSSRVHGFHSDTCHTPNGQCFHDNSHFTPDRQSIKVGKLNQEGTAHNSVYENYEMINGRSTLTDYKYMNGYDNSKTKSVKENGFMVTKL